MGRVRKKARRSESFFSYAMVTPTVVVLLVMSVFALIFTFYYSFTDYYYISLEGPVSMGWITISPFLRILILSGPFGTRYILQ